MAHNRAHSNDISYSMTEKLGPPLSFPMKAHVALMTVQVTQRFLCSGVVTSYHVTYLYSV
jgi:hypothetical protein